MRSELCGYCRCVQAYRNNEGVHAKSRSGIYLLDLVMCISFPVLSQENFLVWHSATIQRMSTVSLPLSLPVKISAQDTQISFTQNDEGVFMNLGLKVDVPLKDLLDSLMQCGDQVRDELTALVLNPPHAPATVPGNSNLQVAANVVVSNASDSGSTACDATTTPEPSYCTVPFPRIDSPYKARGKWQSDKATYFLRERKLSVSTTANTVHSGMGKRQLSPNAPVFTPQGYGIHHRGDEFLPLPSPLTQCSVAGSDGVWELPGLASPLMESTVDPIYASDVSVPALVQSILQRGLSSSQYRRM